MSTRTDCRPTFAASEYSRHPLGCGCFGCGTYGVMGLGSGASKEDIVAAYGISSSLANKIVEVAGRLGIPDPGMLANVINFESRFNPQAVNPSSGATGLIQFMPRTAPEVGTTTAALRGMSAERQMDYVQKYFELQRIKNKGPLRTQLDVFMAVFYPEAIGKGMTYSFGYSPADIVANHGIRTAGDYYAKAMRNARLIPNEMPLPRVADFARGWKVLTLASLSILTLGGVGYWAATR